MFYSPRISEDEFPALATILQRPPETYSEWLTLVADLERAYGKAGVTPVPVSPRNFAAYMTNAGRKLDMQALLDFAAFNPWHGAE